MWRKGGAGARRSRVAHPASPRRHCSPAAASLLANEAEQVAGLPVVVIAFPMVVARRIAGELERRLVKAEILDRAIERVRLIIGVGTAGRRLEEAHRPVLVIIMGRAARAIDREWLAMPREPA